jgi:hypothetical protein
MPDGAGGEAMVDALDGRAERRGPAVDVAVLGAAAPDGDAATTATAAVAGGVRERIARPPPPRKGQIPIAQEPAGRETATTVEAAEGLGRRALERTEGALQRILLEQWAVLDDHGDAAGGGAGRGGREWTAELPLATASGTSVVQMTVERDAGGGAKAAATVGWRVRFALDIEPIGPVHAQIGLAGEHLSVGLWVERPDMAARLAAEVGDLTAALADDRLTIEAVHVAAGEPPAAKGEGGGAGHFIDVSL